MTTLRMDNVGIVVDDLSAAADGRHRKLHANPCDDWGKRARLGDEVWEEPILAQLEGVELDDATIGAVVASLGSEPRPVALDLARIERHIRDLARSSTPPGASKTRPTSRA